MAYEEACEELNLAKSQVLHEEARQHQGGAGGSEEVSRLEAQASDLGQELRTINDQLILQVQAWLGRLDVHWTQLIEQLHTAMGQRYAA